MTKPGERSVREAVSIGSWVFEPEDGTLSRRDETITLSPRTGDLLSFLVASAGQLVTKASILDTVWPAKAVSDAALTQRIMELRRILEDDARHPKYIETVARRGYRFVAPVRPTTLSSASTEETVAILLAQIGSSRDEGDAAATFRERVERRLGQHPRIVVSPPDRVADAIRLLRRTPPEKLDHDLALVAAQRDGRIGAVVSGSVRRLDSTHALELKLVDAAEPERARWLGATHPGDIGLIDAMEELSKELTEVVARTDSEQRLRGSGWPRVTTHSATALASFTRALDLADSFRWAKACDLLESAVREDPAFVSAWSWLAWAHLWLEEPEAAHTAAARARELAGGVGDHERHLAEATHASFFGTLQDVINHLELLWDLDPDDFWGTFRLAQCYATAGRIDDSLAMRRDCARIRPNHALNHSEAAFTHLFAAGDLVEARRESSRVLEIDPHHPFALPFLMPSFEAWLESDLERSQKIVNEVLELRLDRLLPLGRVSALVHASRLKLFLGQADEAIDLIHRGLAETSLGSSVSAWIRLELALTELDLGHETSFRKQIEMLGNDPSALSRAHALLWGGLADIGAGSREAAETAGREIEEIARGPWLDFGLPSSRTAAQVRRGFPRLLLGEEALAHGDPTAAGEHFSAAAEALPLAIEGPVAVVSPGPRAHIHAREGLARAFDAAGHAEDALTAESWLLDRPLQLLITARAGVGTWNRALSRRADLHARAGCHDDARRDARAVLDHWQQLDPEPEAVRKARDVLRRIPRRGE